MSKKKIPLKDVMSALDRKDYGYFMRLGEEDRKSVTPFLLNRYMSLVKGSTDVQVYYLLATNRNVNAQYFSLSKHPDLMWKLLCTVSPNIGSQFHQWLGKKKSTTDKEKRKQLEQLYPDMTERDLDVLESVITNAEIKQLIEDQG